MLKKLDTFLQEGFKGCGSSTPTPSIKSPTPAPTPSMSMARTRIEKAISESSDLISALECVGAMYGIPATNIIADDAATGIRIQNDNIIAPPLPNPAAQSKPIMQAIGTVLDYISQRIDDKLNDYQLNNIRQGHNDDMIANANPNKGKCIGRYEDDEGGEILAYDTGLVDSPHTPAAMAKIKELRETNQIPTFDPSANRPSGIGGLSYFTDEDDITSDVDMGAAPEEMSTDSDMGGAEVNDVSDQIQESAYHLNMINKFDNTTHLGYDLLRRQGFDFIKPIDSMIMESADNSISDKNLKLEDFKHMKFDNTELLKAVECFNKARDVQGTIQNGKMNLREFVRDKSFSEGISHIEKQFNCHISLKFVKDGKNNNVGTEILNDIKQKITVSKSKGFQLNGLSISIIHFGRYFEASAPDDSEKMFGQRMVGTICHEIFHNIAAALRYESVRNSISLVMTMNLAASAKTPKEKRVIITNYVNSLDAMYKNKLFDKMAKKNLIKKLTIMASINDESELKKANKIFGSDDKDSDPDKYIDGLIKKVGKANSKTSFGGARYQLRSLFTFAMSAIALSLKPAILWLQIPIAVLTFIDCLIYITNGVDYFTKRSKKHIKENSDFEEYYCDLFAGMYQLPIAFFVGSEFNDKEKRTPNEFDPSKLNKLAKLEKELHENIGTRYPTDLERTHAGVTVAKSLLESDGLDESTKRYCQWIVDNFSDIHTTDIDTIFNARVFDPKEAEDLDKHLERLIKENGIPITESFIRWMCSDKLITERGD